VDGVARIGTHALLAGDAISMDGATGRVYLGVHTVTTHETTVGRRD
jgi:hypothetical protein